MTPEEMRAMLDTKFKAVQDELATAQANNVSKDEILKLHEAVKKQGQDLQDFIESQNKKVNESIKEQLRKFLVDKKDELSKIYKNGHGVIEFIPKVVGDMATTSGGDFGTPPPNFNTSLGHFNLADNSSLLSLFSTTKTNRPSLVYTELEPKDGDYAFVGEGAAKPQIDFKWTNRYSNAKKAAAHEVLSEEVVTDIPRMTSVAEEYLSKKHGLFKVDGLFFGDGLGDNVKGATVYGRTFVAGAMALKVTNPQFMDVVNACITDIYTTTNYTDEAPYMANAVLVNPVDFYLNLVSAKDANGLPLYPQAGLFNQVNIGGVVIRPWYKIPAGKIFVGDLKVYNVVDYIPFSIRIGWINDQFIKNQFTMVGESRFHGYVKNLDANALIYDTYDTIKTAITKI